MGKKKKQEIDNITWSVTGHRPDKIFYKGVNCYNTNSFNHLVTFCENEIIKELNHGDEIWTGMAQGWDMAIAVACARKNIRFLAAVPFKGQEIMWPPFWQDVYKRLLLKAAKVKIVSPGKYEAVKMHIRNEFMVDKADKILCFHNGDIIGGTASCLKYAKVQNKTIINLWDKWVEYNKKG